MGFEDFIKKTTAKIKEMNDPEKIKSNLKNKIEVEKLRCELDEIKAKRRAEHPMYMGGKRII